MVDTSMFKSIANNPQRIQQEIDKRNKYIKRYERGTAPSNFNVGMYRNFLDQVKTLRNLQAQFAYPDKQEVTTVYDEGINRGTISYTETTPASPTPNDTTYITASGPVSMAPIVAQQQNTLAGMGDTLRYDTQGKGYSIAPTLVPTRSKTIVGSLKQVTFADNRTSIIDTGTTTIYGKEIVPQQKKEKELNRKD
jgi:hypothetical protein